METKRVRQTQAERREEAERRIVEATIRLVARQGFASFTLSEVGEEAGYSRGLPAHYFGPKENLLLRVATHILDQFQGYAHHLANPDKSAIEEIFRVYAYATRRNPDFARATVMIYSEALINPLFADKLKPLVRERQDAIAEILDAAVARGEIAPLSDSRIEAAKIFALLRGALNLSAIDPEFPVEQVFDAYCQSLRAPAEDARPARKR